MKESYGTLSETPNGLKKDICWTLISVRNVLLVTEQIQYYRLLILRLISF